MNRIFIIGVCAESGQSETPACTSTDLSSSNFDAPCTSGNPADDVTMTSSSPPGVAEAAGVIPGELSASEDHGGVSGTLQDFDERTSTIIAKRVAAFKTHSI